MLKVFVSFFAFIKCLKVRLFCIKDYKEVLQEKKCCSEAAGYSPWSVPALLQSLGWKLQILAPSSRVFGQEWQIPLQSREVMLCEAALPNCLALTCLQFIHTVLTWIVRWEKTSAQAVNTDQCHEPRDSEQSVYSNSPKSWVTLSYNASSCLWFSRALPQQIGLSLDQSTWDAR